MDDNIISQVSSSIVREGVMVSDDQHTELCAPFTSKDVKRALFDIALSKAARLDGYSSGFFKRACPCVGT